MKKPLVSSQFGAFLITGGIAALVNVLSRVLFSRWLDFSIAVVLAYGLGMVTAYLLARIFVFRETRQGTLRSVAYFCAVNGVALLQTWGASLLTLHYVLPSIGWTFQAPLIAHFVGVVIPVFTSYVGHKYLTFR